MTEPRKFRKGRRIRSVQQLVDWMGHVPPGWVYWPTSERPKPPRVIENMTLLTLRQAIEAGRLCEAFPVITVECGN